MAGRKILFGFLVLMFVFSIASCDLFEDAFTVPSWARGKWYVTPSLGALDEIGRPLAVEITSKELIPSPTFNSLPGIKRTTVTIATDNIVQFDLISVKKGDANNEIEIGFNSLTITLYK